MGVIVCKRRLQTIKKPLKEAGLNEEQLVRFHSPVGLELNAESPEEIAETIMLRRGGTRIVSGP